MEVVLGIDGGGTTCRAALAAGDGRVLGRGVAGPANIMTDLEGARANIVEAARLAFRDAGRDPAGLCAAGAVLGLAGANVGDCGERLRAMLPFGQSLVETDVLIALNGALGDHDGAVAIVGTGSAFMARHEGKVRAIGGWGFAVGDLGSGARLGRDLLEEALLVHDGIHHGSALTEAVLARFHASPDELVAFATGARPVDFGAFAPMVFEYADAGDAVARLLASRSVGHVEEALAALGLGAGDRLCLLGGLARNVAARLSPAYAKLLAPPLGDALGGAVAMAASRFGSGGGH